MVIALCSILAPFLVPIHQAYVWLQKGVWKPLKTDVIFSAIMPDIYVWLAEENSSWLGVKKIVKYVTCDMSLFSFLLLLGCVVFFSLMRFLDVLEKEKRMDSKEIDTSGG
ncbi:MAG: hypothetical protein JXM79_18565 [Sedimentisphaerales bacterium]|nr:hypothetical protein [Sedimentisphaerales bacterium]